MASNNDQACPTCGILFHCECDCDERYCECVLDELDTALADANNAYIATYDRAMKELSRNIEDLIEAIIDGDTLTDEQEALLATLIPRIKPKEAEKG